MSAQHLTSPTPQLDAHFNGIRIEFDRLNQELNETRKQRDEYKTNYRNQEKELREFITTLLQRLDDKNQICQHCRGDITRTAGLADDNASISPPSPSIEYYFPLEENSEVPDRLDKTENSIGISPVEEERNHDNDVRDGAILAENEGPTISGITSPSLLLDKLCSNDVRVDNSGWDVMYVPETEIAMKLDLVHELTQRGGSVAISPDGKYLAIESDAVACIFDVNTGERISVMRVLCENPDDIGFDTCLDFSPDNNYLAMGNEVGEVRIWIISQKRVRNMFRLQSYTADLRFSPNGQHLVTASYGTVRIWRLRDGSSTALTNGQYKAWAARFSPDGRYVALDCNLGQIVIWNVRTRRLVTTWKGHSSPVSSLLFTPDGKGLLTAASDKGIVCWDIAWLGLSGDDAEGEQDDNSTVAEISSFASYRVGVYRVAISPDGQWIAHSSYFDNTVKIWNTSDATLQCTLRGPGEVRSVAFSPVGTYLAIGGDFPQVTIWNYSCTAISPL